MSITKPNSTYRILPVERLDPPVLIEISHLAFATDTHTLFKMHEKGTTDMDTEMPGEMYERDYKDMERNRMIKAVDEKGQLVGFSVWRKWNFDGAHPAVRVSPHSPTCQHQSLLFEHLVCLYRESRAYPKAVSVSLKPPKSRHLSTPQSPLPPSPLPPPNP